MEYSVLLPNILACMGAYPNFIHLICTRAAYIEPLNMCTFMYMHVHINTSKPVLDQEWYLPRDPMIYCIAQKFGGELNLVVWRFGGLACDCQIEIRQYFYNGDLGPNCQI